MFCLLVLALVPPETLDMEDKSEANTAVTIGSEDFATVYRSCFSDTMNNNMSVTSVNIGDKVLTIMGDTVDLVMEAGAALEKCFNVVPEEREIEEAEAGTVEAGAVEAVLPALPGEDVVARQTVARPPRCPPRTVPWAGATRTRGRRCSRQRTRTFPAPP